MTTIGEAIVRYLEERELPVVFGLPGVHTVELYRGLAQSKIRHVIARHEQGAGFMADGFARVSGQPGVAFVITGPGVTNILTAMAQARSDSVPMLVVSSVNERAGLGLGLGHLHELPDQQGVCALVACRSEQVTSDAELMPALHGIYQDFATKRPGPMHLEAPLDVMGASFDQDLSAPDTKAPPVPGPELLKSAAGLLSRARQPVILAGGGARWAEDALLALAEQLNAPVVQTINARGLMHGHPLTIPASASLEAVRDLLRESDAILAVGTELGTTDYDIYRNGGLPELSNMVRIDICPDQLARHPADVKLCGMAADVLPLLSRALGEGRGTPDWGAEQAAETRLKALAELPGDYAHQVEMLNCIRDSCPNSIIVGDSTQPIYAGNLYYDHDCAGGWFNSSVGYGALGYGIPAAIGAALAAPDRQVVCITGDGGAQFTLPELMTALDEKLPIIFVIWNNAGYLEIETSMADANVEVVDCDPTPPDFEALAKACSMSFRRCENSTAALSEALKSHKSADGPMIIEVDVPR